MTNPTSSLKWLRGSYSRHPVQSPGCNSGKLDGPNLGPVGREKMNRLQLVPLPIHFISIVFLLGSLFTSVAPAESLYPFLPGSNSGGCSYSPSITCLSLINAPMSSFTWSPHSFQTARAPQLRDSPGRQTQLP